MALRPPRAEPRYAKAQGLQLLLAGDLRLRGTERPGPRDLRRDQKCRHDGRKADQPQKLIHREHRFRPQGSQASKGKLQKTASIRPFGYLLLIG